ncbi:hypothetical protein F5051DRAFT_344133 [Lentinula edodes]|nr:hypothetical protein F5051DRAFT_344133 [Lentinula edodes]
MASGDVALVRGEVKAWERSFYQENGRNPTVDDIRANQQIANKYRLYKKLSKATSSVNPDSNRRSSSTRPSTPPRKTEPSSSVISKSRALETTSALSTYNPFSPQKNKEKQRAPVGNVSLILSNPFATPSKVKPKARVREPSPSPIHETIPTLSTLRPSASETPTGIVRARKRLRGEPVSPSPNKDKRRRMLSRTNMSRRDSGSSDSREDDEEVGNSSFVADSPVKGSSSKSFMSLFEDASTDPKVKTALTRTKSTSASVGLFGPLRSQSVPFEDDFESILGPFEGKLKSRLRTTANGIPFSSELVPKSKKDGLYLMQDPIPQPSHAHTVEKYSINDRISRKRQPDSESDSEQLNLNPLTSATILIPPSPPRETPSQRSVDLSSSKGKGKAFSRKKTKLDDDDDMDSLSVNVKVLPIVSRPSRASDEDRELDAGPEFDSVHWYNRRVEPPRVDNGEHTNNTFEVDLPEKLKHVLAFSSSDIEMRHIQEEQVVESLIYGRRRGHYEPSKGGEIWDVGDTDAVGLLEEAGDMKAIADEDWEGEPVPWEVGEL